MRQIAYVVGFGLLWDEAELLQDPSVGSDAEVATGQDTHFSGTAARAACDEVGPAYTGLTWGNGVLDLHGCMEVIRTGHRQGPVTPTALPYAAPS